MKSVLRFLVVTVLLTVVRAACAGEAPCNAILGLKGPFGSAVVANAVAEVAEDCAERIYGRYLTIIENVEILNQEITLDPGNTGLKRAYWRILARKIGYERRYTDLKNKALEIRQELQKIEAETRERLLRQKST